MLGLFSTFDFETIFTSLFSFLLTYVFIYKVVIGSILPFPHQVTLWAQFPMRNNPPFWLKPSGAFPGVSLSVPPMSHLGAGWFQHFVIINQAVTNVFGQIPLSTSRLLLVCVPHRPKERGICLVLPAHCPVTSRWF